MAWGVVGAVTFDRRRSEAGLELTDRGDRSMETRAFGTGEFESVTPLLNLLTLGVAGVSLPGVSDKLLDLFKFKV